MRLRALLALVLALLLPACASRGPSPVIPVARVASQRGFVEEGIASWHGPSRFSRESRTASGKKWSNSALIAAHKTLRLGSLVRVRNLRNGQEATLQITDRGPYVPGRILDISPRAAELLGFRANGIARVRLEVVE
jgi:rare lipoprotein A